MTREELAQADSLRREIAGYDRRIQELRDRAVSAAQRQSGGTGGNRGRSDRVGGCAAAIADLQAKRDACQVRLDRIESYIADIPDQMIRRAMEDHYLHGLRWRQAAARLGGGNTADATRIACSRWVENHP